MRRQLDFHMLGRNERIRYQVTHKVGTMGNLTVQHVHLLAVPFLVVFVAGVAEGHFRAIKAQLGLYIMSVFQFSGCLDKKDMFPGPTCSFSFLVNLAISISRHVSSYW